MQARIINTTFTDFLGAGSALAFQAETCFYFQHKF